MTGMTTPQMLAIAVGAFELISGLMIALNFGARFFAILMIFFVAAATFYYHDFWNQSSPENAQDARRCAEECVDHRRAVHDRGLWPYPANDWNRSMRTSKPAAAKA